MYVIYCTRFHILTMGYLRCKSPALCVHLFVYVEAKICYIVVLCDRHNRYEHCCGYQLGRV